MPPATNQTSRCVSRWPSRPSRGLRRKARPSSNSRPVDGELNVKKSAPCTRQQMQWIMLSTRCQAIGSEIRRQFRDPQGHLVMDTVAWCPEICWTGKAVIGNGRPYPGDHAGRGGIARPGPQRILCAWRRIFGSLVPTDARMVRKGLAREVVRRVRICETQADLDIAVAFIYITGDACAAAASKLSRM